VRHGPLSPDLSLGLSFEVDPLSVVNQAVKDCVCKGRIWDTHMPISYWHLAGNQRR